MKKSILLGLLFVYSFSYSQTVNNYVYALVPSKFTFLKEKDQYNLNTLTKLLMGKYGFTPYLDSDVLPDEMTNCKRINVDVISVGDFFTTKLKVILKDCKNNILFTSAEGKSKEKDYRVAYNQALRNAFISFDSLHYKYTPTAETISVIPETVVVTSASIVPISTSSEVFFAQPIANGFQLVDSTPKVVMKIFNTSNKNCFLAEKGTIKGVLLSNENQWFFEYYHEGKLISEKVNVKF